MTEEERVDALAGLLWGGVPDMWPYVRENYPETAARQRELARFVLNGELHWQYRPNRRGHMRRRLVTVWTGVPDAEQIPGDGAQG